VHIVGGRGRTGRTNQHWAFSFKQLIGPEIEKLEIRKRYEESNGNAPGWIVEFDWIIAGYYFGFSN